VPDPIGPEAVRGIAEAALELPGADGVEVLAHLLHPDEYPDPGVPWSRVRL